MASATKKTHVSPEKLREWASLAQTAFLDALMRADAWKVDQLAFQGGTSLHLSWRSPRFSEDLDFLISREQEDRLGSLIKKIERNISESVMLTNPSLKIEIRSKTRPGSNLLNYQIVVSDPDRYYGSAMVKAEFWKVDQDYLSQYKTEFVFPMKPGDLVVRSSLPIPAATLESAYADKLTAFATRPYLKWRDVFDLWWIGRQLPLDPKEMAARFLHHVSAYNTINDLPPPDALSRFLDLSDDYLLEKSDPDLRQWLPDALWQTLYPEGVRQMIAYTKKSIMDVSFAAKENRAVESDNTLDDAQSSASP